MALKPEKPANAAFFHHPDAVDMSRAKLMGRHAAGAGFLAGYVRHSDVDAFYGHCQSSAHFGDFKARIEAAGGGGKPVRWIAPGRLDSLETPGCMFYPGPGLGAPAWRRRAFGARRYSLCGVNHTIASDTIMDSIGALLTSPVQPWDAVVCTSRAARDVIKRMLTNYGQFLNARLDGKARVGVQLPIIPLGVDCSAYPRGVRRQAARTAFRNRHGIAEDDIAVLFVGRLSFHAKAHPIPLYLALEEAARRSGKTVHLIQAGWFANEAIEREFRAGAQAFCPSVKAVFLDGRDAAVRTEAWMGADIFSSLSDNIQETFGLTPIEAMAAGLPSVVSDWDGYRDTVRSGIDGFAVPTWMPPGGAGGGLELPYDGEASPEERDQAYNLYCGRISQATAVDVGACVVAFNVLIENPERRRTMGEAARKRARERFDWSVVVAGYQALWRELEAIRKGANEIAPLVPGSPPHPLREDPFALFTAYPSRGRRDDVTVQPMGTADAERLKRFRGREFTDFAANVMPTDAEFMDLLTRLDGYEGESATASALLADVPPERRATMDRGLGWLGKMGLLRLVAMPKVPLPVSPSDWDEVDARLRAYLEETPNDVDVLRALANTARARSDIQTAVNCLNRIITLEPTNSEAFVALGKVFAAANQFDKAIECFRRAVVNDPSTAENHGNLGRAHFSAGESGRAVDAFLRALRLAPWNTDLWTRLGVALRHEDHAAEARECLEKAVALGGKDAFLHYHLGLACNGMGDSDGARAAFERALEQQPSFVLAAAALDSMAVGSNEEGTRVALYMRHDHHYRLLKPLFEPLAARGPVLFTGDAGELKGFDPQIVLFSDPAVRQLAEVAPDAVRVMVPCGLLLRNGGASAAEVSDHVCAASEGHASILRDAGVPEAKIVTIGALALDGLFGGDPGQAPFEVPAGRKVVLYAPTAEPAATSAFALGAHVGERLRGGRDDILVAVKPHPLMLRYAGPLIAAWREAAAKDPAMALIVDPSVDPAACLAAADVLVTDRSSMAFEFAALDRPVVFVDVRHTEAEAGSLEAVWGDIGETVSSVDDVGGAVARALDDPSSFGLRRRECRDTLFGGMDDGGAKARILTFLENLDLSKR